MCHLYLASYNTIAQGYKVAIQMGPQCLSKREKVTTKGQRKNGQQVYGIITYFIDSKNIITIKSVVQMYFGQKISSL